PGGLELLLVEDVRAPALARDRRQRIAGQHAHGDEDQQGDAEDRGDRDEQALSQILAHGSAVARVASVRPRGLSALRRYAPPVSPLAIQPEGVDATELREDAGLAVVALDRVAPHGQMVGEPDEVERRGLVQERHALREELLALALVRLAVDLLQQLVELRIGVARE